jgi:DNA-binding transcriptional MerR regulator
VRKPAPDPAAQTGPATAPNTATPVAKIRRFADLVREGPGNEHERLEQLREQQRRVENQLAELAERLRIITGKVGVYEQQLADGTARDLSTAKA